MESFPTALDPAPARASLRVRLARRPFLLLSGLLFLYTAALVVYSQTMGFVWDEGFHILTAQLIAHGRMPYIDFCFPQPPLNAYWNAAWLAFFNQSWRATHVVAALETAAAVFLITDFVFSRFPVGPWRFPCALVAAFFTGFSTIVVQFATVAQAYGVGLLLLVAAFRVVVAAASRKNSLLVFAAGLLAGSAAGCTLLTAPAAPVLLAWIWIYNRDGNRRAKAGAFVAGAIIPFAPVFWLFSKAPRQVFFNIVQYQAMFRRVNWTGATPHDVDVLSAWLADSQSLLLGLLAIAGVWFVAKKSNWERVTRSEYYLCAWLSLALILYISIAHPTFTRYFIFAIPFLAVLACAGVYFVGSRLTDAARPLLPAGLVIGLVTLALARSLFDDRDSVTWYDYQDIARRVDQVTPPNGRLYADELVYFLTRRTPPPGMEFSYAHKLQLSPPQEKLYHIVSESELTKQVKAGQFDTVQSCNDDRIDDMNLPNLFPHKTDVGDCSIFWGKVKSGPAKKTSK